MYAAIFWLIAAPSFLAFVLGCIANLSNQIATEEEQPRQPQDPQT